MFNVISNRKLSGAAPANTRTKKKEENNLFSFFFCCVLSVPLSGSDSAGGPSVSSITRKNKIQNKRGNQKSFFLVVLLTPPCWCLKHNRQDYSLEDHHHHRTRRQQSLLQHYRVSRSHPIACCQLVRLSPLFLLAKWNDGNTKMYTEKRQRGRECRWSVIWSPLANRSAVSTFCPFG